MVKPDLKQRDSTTKFRVFLRVTLSVGQENKFWDAFSGVCGAVILCLFKYVKVLTNLILFWSIISSSGAVSVKPLSMSC